MDGALVDTNKGYIWVSRLVSKNNSCEDTREVSKENN